MTQHRHLAAAHQVAIEGPTLDGPHRARCDCGWTGEPRTTIKAAVDEHTAHVGAVAAIIREPR